MRILITLLLLVALFSTTSCSNSSDYKPKKIEYSGTNTEKFRKAAEKVMTEYRNDITTALNNRDWPLVQRELMDYWELVDNMTPSQTGNIWTNEDYQNAYDNFASKIIIEEARELISKQNDDADDILIELIMTVQPNKWSTVDRGPYSNSSGETVLEKVRPTVISLAEMKGRSRIIEFFLYNSTF